MDKPAKPDDETINEAGDKDGNSSVPSAVETFHVEPIPDAPAEPKPEIRFEGVEYERRVHSLPILGYAYSVEPVITRPESPEEANDALSRCCAILALLHARMGEPGDVRQVEFCVVGEERIQDALIGRLSSLVA